MSRRRTTAFTLIELLVVIAILSLLVSILIPSLTQAKQQAQGAVCLSHLRGVGTAAMMYAHDNVDSLPWGNNNLWFQAFLPYVGSEDRTKDYRSVGIYRCPSYPDKRQTICFVASSWGFSSRTDMVGTEINRLRKLSEFSQPANTLFLADNENGWWRQIIVTANDPRLDSQDVNRPSHLPTSLQEDWTLGRRVARRRHNEGCNGLFLDGHASWLGYRQVTIDMWRDKR